MDARRSDPGVPALPAATVILVRDAADGLQVWLLRRVRGLAFAGGASVFPGGRVDAADVTADLPGAGAAGSVAGFAARFGCSVAEAHASAAAAIRETFEETGVLLTRPPYAVATAPDERWLADQRRRVEAHEVAFTAVLSALGVAIDVDLIRPWARWITPAGEPRRYDTHFYVAALPRGSRPDSETTEASHGGWITPTRALSKHGRGQRPMLAPTVVALDELAGFTTVDDVLAASSLRSLAPVRPELTTADGLITVRLPDGRRFSRPSAGS